MMHASTSPFYPIIASNEIAAAMMDGASGVALTTESIREAVSFRQIVGRIKRQLTEAGEWFFSTWNPTEVMDPATGGRVAFEDAPEALLITDPNSWVLHPGGRMAWIRGTGRRLLHARPDQGHRRGAWNEAAHRILATSVVPYPPGIPMIMPGENFGPAHGPYIGYLKALRDWDGRFPGFGHETHGVEVRDGEHYLHCVKQEAA